MDHIKIELDFIPVEERLPEGRVHVLCLTPTGKVCECFYIESLRGVAGFSVRGIGNTFDVTHWAEVPEIGE